MSGWGVLIVLPWTRLDKSIWATPGPELSPVGSIAKSELSFYRLKLIMIDYLKKREIPVKYKRSTKNFSIIQRDYIFAIEREKINKT